ncbi:MBL fold metallo-hydrolase [Muricoccus vinaceus]|uniref:MBL fold metallo-hydrolase n=1 Tax=Muricoccus vinaceus TaxID=424704 RepID=A0ABV6IYT4_9PROT
MAFEIDFLPVGVGTRSGDAICIRYANASGSFSIHVVDGGYSETGPEIVKHINENYNYPSFIDNVVLTHPDSDHVSGLFNVLESFSVGTLWMNRPWLHASEIIHRFHGNWTTEGLTSYLRKQFSTLVELEELAISKGTIVKSPFQGSNIGPFVVLAPSRTRYLDLLVDLPNTPAEVKSKKGSFFDTLAKSLEEAKIAIANYISETWYGETLSEYPEPTGPSNESSVVQFLYADNEHILLTGDVGPGGLTEARDYYESSLYYASKMNLMQVPHHGSRRNVTPFVLSRWLGEVQQQGQAQRGYAVCSAAKDDLDHPKAKVENAFLRRGYPVYTTNGQLLAYSRNMPSRGYGAATPAPFRSRVEE